MSKQTQMMISFSGQFSASNLETVLLHLKLSAADLKNKTVTSENRLKHNRLFANFPISSEKLFSRLAL